jgi:hypothetical protein
VKASHTIDAIRTRFGDEHLVANAGLLLPATLMRRLRLAELLRWHGPQPGSADRLWGTARAALECPGRADRAG